MRPPRPRHRRRSGHRRPRRGRCAASRRRLSGTRRRRRPSRRPPRRAGRSRRGRTGGTPRGIRRPVRDHDQERAGLAQDAPQLGDDDRDLPVGIVGPAAGRAVPAVVHADVFERRDGHDRVEVRVAVREVAQVGVGVRDAAARKRLWLRCECHYVQPLEHRQLVQVLLVIQRRPRIQHARPGREARQGPRKLDDALAQARAETGWQRVPAGKQRACARQQVGDRAALEHVDVEQPRCPREHAAVDECTDGALPGGGLANRLDCAVHRPAIVAVGVTGHRA